VTSLQQSECRTKTINCSKCGSISTRQHAPATATTTTTTTMTMRSPLSAALLPGWSVDTSDPRSISADHQHSAASGTSR